MHREIGRVSAKPNLLDHKLGPGSTTPENRSNLDRFRHYEKQRDHQHHRHLLLALFCFGLFHHGLLQPISGRDSFCSDIRTWTDRPEIYVVIIKLSDNGSTSVLKFTKGMQNKKE